MKASRTGEAVAGSTFLIACYINSDVPSCDGTDYRLVFNTQSQYLNQRPITATMLFLALLVLMLSRVIAATEGLDTLSSEYNVNWTVQDGCDCDNCTYQAPTDHIKECTGIKGFKYCELTKPRVWHYAIEIDVEPGWCRSVLGTTYSFTDSEPSTYHVSCHKPGRHYVHFNSKDPKIRKVDISKAQKKCEA